MDMLRIEKNRVSHFFDGSAIPAAYAKSGEMVVFCCQDCYNDQLKDGEDLRKKHIAHYNPITGPLYVEEAQPGDVLKVEICRIKLPESGIMSVRKGTGSYKVEGSYTRRFFMENGEILFDGGIHLKATPMVGTIGNAPPPGHIIPSDTPGEHGGNLDIRDLGEGAVLYLPVFVQGALLSMGDLHALQGDGESAICGLETSGEVTVKVSLCKGREDIPTPLILANGHYLTTAADPSLDVCSLAAARKMHCFLLQHTQLSDAQCAMLLSLKGNLRVSQIVNPAKGCMMEFPIGLAGEIFEG
jgi:amidase